VSGNYLRGIGIKRIGFVALWWYGLPQHHHAETP